MRFLFAGHTLDTDRRELLFGNTAVALEPRVFDLLSYLVANRNRVVSKDDVLDSVWSGRIVSESALTTRIAAARRAIGDTGELQSLIRTIPRKGFRFVGEVREEADPAGPRTETPSPGPAATEVLALPDKPSIAVLPFANILFRRNRGRHNRRPVPGAFAIRNFTQLKLYIQGTYRRPKTRRT
jgi:adenylate cyclase